MIPVLLSALTFVNFAHAESKLFSFYGKQIKVDVASELYSLAFPAKPTEKNLTALFQKAATKKVGASFEQLNVQAKAMNLDNIGTFQLYRYFVLNAFPKENANFKKAMVWYGMRQSGLDAILAGDKDFLNLYVNLDQPVDGGYFVTVKGKKYFSADAGTNFPKGIFIYNPNVFTGNAREGLSLDVNKRPVLGNTTEKKRRSFNTGTKTYNLVLNYNKDYVNYLNDLPSLRTGTHMYKLAPSVELAKSLDDSLNRWMKHMSYEQKRGFLLKMVQEGFRYKADTDYRKHEKRNFVEQTAADDFTDCEDRAAFFNYLAARYLKTETIILYSKEKMHVNCALLMDDAATGYTFKYKGKKYLIMEPAYLGFRPGETDHTKEELQNKFEVCL